MVRSIILILASVISLNGWANGVAESQAKAKKRYKDFIGKLKEDAADEKLNQLEKTLKG